MHDPMLPPEEARAREINEQPWDPLPGMHKRRCEECQYWFASSGAARCPDCTGKGQRLRRPDA